MPGDIDMLRNAMPWRMLCHGECYAMENAILAQDGECYGELNWLNIYMSGRCIKAVYNPV